MEMQVGPLASRAMSSFALSIGTALALESLFKGPLPVYDPARVIPQHIEIKDYEQIWINLSTLVRNIYSSVPTADQMLLMGVDMFLTLESEVEIIRSLINDGSLGKTKVVFYVTDDSRLAAKHSHAQMRKDVTDKQRAYTHLKTVVLDEFLRRHRNIPGLMVFHERLLPAQKTTALVLTHDAYDLLSWPMFEQLHLLESHTGILKKRTQWYTKYHNGKELMRIPFNSCFMQVFGDSLHFHPWALQDRKEIKDLADRREWTALTTKERLVLSFDLMPNKVLAQVLKEMLGE